MACSSPFFLSPKVQAFAPLQGKAMSDAGKGWWSITQKTYRSGRNHYEQNKQSVRVVALHLVILGYKSHVLELGLSWLVGWLGGQIKFSYIYSCELWLKQALVKETSGTSDFIGGDLKKNTHPFPKKKGIRKWIIDLFCIFLALSFRCNRIHTPSNILKYHFPSFLLR